MNAGLLAYSTDTLRFPHI